MRVFLIIILLFVFSITVFSQVEKKTVVRLSPSKIKEKIIEQDFPNVPRQIREHHATGKWRFLITVDEDGKVKEVYALSKYPDFLNEYLEKTIKSWKFKPLNINEENVSFTGILFIPFCYGSFSSWCLD